MRPAALGLVAGNLHPSAAAIAAPRIRQQGWVARDGIRRKRMREGTRNAVEALAAPNANDALCRRRRQVSREKIQADSQGPPEFPPGAIGKRGANSRRNRQGSNVFWP